MRAQCHDCGRVLVKTMAGRSTNAYLIFDHRDDWHYKFAGLQVSSGRWVIGAVHGGAETILVESTATPPQADRWYTLDLVVELNKVTLYADGADTVTWTRAAGQIVSGGWVGGAARFGELEQWDVVSVTKTYSSGGQRVALRRDGALYYVHTDHLGSSSLLTTEQGQEVPGTRLKYFAYGDPRPDGQATVHNAFARDYTPVTFTGQKRDAGTGLMYYGARWYDSQIGVFLSADTIVPNPGSPAGMNRYAYVGGNPLRYVDSNGHCGPLTPVCIGLILGGMLFLLQGDSPDANISPEDVTSQRLGGALLVGGATLAAGGALVGTAGVAQAGTTAATAACADGDCTNEVRSAGQIVQNAARATESGVALRQQYESAVRSLSDKAAQMRSAGKSAEEIARSLSAERRALGEQFKAMTHPDALEQIYARNLERYGDKLGPTIEWLVEQGLKQGKSIEQIWESIIEKSGRPGGGDIIPKLLDK